jgi:hypothetical protein
MAAVALAAMVLAIVHSYFPSVSDSTRGNPFGNPAGMVDRLVLLDRPEAWAAGKLEHVKIDAVKGLVTLAADSDYDYPRQGVWTSAELTTDFPFTELIPSWNANVPAASGMAVLVRVRDARRGDWSPWLYFGGWGQAPPGAHTVQFDHGKVYTDALMLDRPANAYQVRVKLASFTYDPGTSPGLRRIAVSYSGVVADETERRRLMPPVTIDGVWARSLAVPYRTQQDTPKALRSQTCSPTSVSMVLEYWGFSRPTVENAMAIYDPEYEQFGTWNRATQRAGELGLDAWLDRFRTWDAVKAQIAQGRPIIASIRYRKGEFPAAVISSTTGHLIVIRGFTAGGDVIVNDPANPKKGNAVVYPAADLAKAWFGHGGVGYVIAGPAKVKAAATKPVVVKSAAQ